MNDVDLATTPCRSCDAPMLWATTIPSDETKTPKGIPLDPQPVDPRTNGGAVACTMEDGQVFSIGRTHLAQIYARDHDMTFAEARDAIMTAFVWRNAHFATCPMADRHRYGKR